MREHKEYRTWLIRLGTCALMTSIAVILDGFLKIPVDLFGAYALKLSFGMVPIIYLSIRLGSMYGGICGALMDLIQILLFPSGAFNPLFSIGAFVIGFLPGIFYLDGKRPFKFRLFVAVLTGQMVGAAILNTLFLIISYQMPWTLFVPRTLTQVILIPLYTLFLYLILAAEAKYIEAGGGGY